MVSIKLHSDDHQEGFNDGSREAITDCWSLSTLAKYLALVGSPTSDYDAGHQEGVKTGAKFNSQSKPHSSYCHESHLGNLPTRASAAPRSL